MKSKTKKTPAKVVKRAAVKAKAATVREKTKTSGTKKAQTKPAVKGSKVPAGKNKSKAAKSIKGKADKETAPGKAKQKSGPASRKTSSLSQTKNTAKGKTPISKTARQPQNQPGELEMTPIAHGQDQHFIPAHKKEVYTPVRDGKTSEKYFHNREEVALHQENQKVKAEMAGRMGRKRIFRILGR